MSATVNPFFTPNQISGCQLWFDAADPTVFSFSSGRSIQTWRDKSSNAYSVGQQSTTLQPVLLNNLQNGLPGIQFTTSTYLAQTATLMPNFTTGSATSVVIAARNASVNTGWNIFNTIWFTPSGTNATTRYHFSFNQNTTDGTTLYINNVLVGQVTSNAVAASANAILGFTASATSATIHTNGSTNTYGGVTLPNATGTTQFIFNDNRNNPAGNDNIAIFEMIGYNIQLSTAQRQQVEGYLAWKWGLQANLPADHPYKTSIIPPLLNPPITNPEAIGNPWVPTQLGSTYLWLDASTSNNFTFSSGTNIASWIDRSGNSYTATAANNPTYDLTNKRVRFLNTSSQSMSNVSAPLNLAQRSFFFVIEDVSYVLVGGYMPIIPNPTTGTDYQTTTGMTIENNVGFKFYANSGGYDNRIAGAAAPNPKGIYSEVFSSLSGTTYLNGTAGGTSNASYTPGTSAGYALGGRWANGIATPYINAYYYEVLVYNTALSTSNRQFVEGYLAWKWNLVGSLPSNHPYKTVPPFSPAIALPAVSKIVSTQWLPSRISGLTLWLDAADTSTVTVSGPGVTQWRDKSGSVNNATATGTIAYDGKIGKYTAMRYSGAFSTYFAGSVSNSGTTLTVFAVYMMNSSSSTVVRIVSLGQLGSVDWQSTLYAAAIIRQTNDITSYRNFTQLGTSTAIFGSPVLNATVYDGTNNTFYQNGTPGTSVASSGNFGYSRYELCASLNEEGSINFNGFLGEVLHYTGALTTSQRQQVEGYLAWKWSLQGSLPVTHPYKYWPPSP